MKTTTILCVTVIMVLAGCEKSQPQPKTQTSQLTQQAQAPPNDVRDLTQGEQLALILADAVLIYDVPKDLLSNLLRTAITPNAVASSPIYGEFVRQIKAQNVAWHKEHPEAGPKNSMEANRMDYTVRMLEDLALGHTSAVRRMQSSVPSK